MKVARLCTTPDENWSRLFRKKHKLKDKDFNCQMQTYKSELAIPMGFWAENMRKLGFEATDIIVNDVGIRLKWLSENGDITIIHRPEWILKSVCQELKLLKPDIIFIYAGACNFINKYARGMINDYLGYNVKYVVLWGDELDPNRYKENFSDIHFAMTVSDQYSEHFNKIDMLNLNVGNAYEPGIKTTPNMRSTDFVFCGVTGFGYPDHINRYEKIIEIGKKTNKLQVYTNEKSMRYGIEQELIILVIKLLQLFPLKVVYSILVRFMGPKGRRLADAVVMCKNFGLDPKLMFSTHSHMRGSYYIGKKSYKQLFPETTYSAFLDGSDYYGIMAASKVVLNIHRDELADVCNVRCFEATGVGSLILTDYREGQEKFFDIENEIVTYRSSDECKEKLNYLLDNPKELDRIKKNGQKRTLKDHTTHNRCETASEIFKSLLKKKHTTISAKNHIFVKKNKINTIHAVYDLDLHPLSYDFIFFLEAAFIKKLENKSNYLIVELMWPKDHSNVDGVSDEAYDAVNVDSRIFRIHHILEQLTTLFGIDKFINNKTRIYNTIEENVFRFPPIDKIPHHSEYYRIVNSQRILPETPKASIQATHYVKKWCENNLTQKKYVAITLRDYDFDKSRNSNIEAMLRISKVLKAMNIDIVLIPDTDNFTGNNIEYWQKEHDLLSFSLASFDVDLRFAIYEKAEFNIFVNNGPCVAATLSNKIKYIMFNTINEKVPHCTQEFLEWSGYKLDEQLPYSTKSQVWTWKEDSFQNMYSEVNKFLENNLSYQP